METTVTHNWTPNQDDDDPRCTSCQADLDHWPHEPWCANLAPGETTWVRFSTTKVGRKTVETQKWNGCTRTVLR